jgi:hypothetical protein
MVNNCRNSDFFLSRNETHEKKFGYKKIWLGTLMGVHYELKIWLHTSFACLIGCAAYEYDQK